MLGAYVKAGGSQGPFQAIDESVDGVPRQPFSSLDAFEQESRPKRRELEISRHRRVEIGCDVKRRLHMRMRILRTIKNPPPALRRRWVLDTDELDENDRPAPTPQERVRHHQALPAMRAVDICRVSPSRASSVKRRSFERRRPWPL